MNSKTAHVNRIMEKKGYLRISGETIGWFERRVTIFGQNLEIHVSTINGLIPKDISVPVAVIIWDPKADDEFLEPIFFDSLKAFLGVNIVERIEEAINDELETEDVRGQS